MSFVGALDIGSDPAVEQQVDARAQQPSLSSAAMAPEAASAAAIRPSVSVFITSISLFAKRHCSRMRFPFPAMVNSGDNKVLNTVYELCQESYAATRSTAAPTSGRWQAEACPTFFPPVRRDSRGLADELPTYWPRGGRAAPTRGCGGGPSGGARRSHHQGMDGDAQ